MISVTTSSQDAPTTSMPLKTPETRTTLASIRKAFGSICLLAIFAVGLALSACVSREAVYQRSLAAAHPDVPESDFEQIAEILSHHTHQSITNVKVLENDEVRVHVAFPGEQVPGSG